MKAKIKFEGINNSENALSLSRMINKARERARADQSEEKAAFIETAEEKEAKFLVEGFDRA